jgi:tetratricopeptide (TPR) repeat protein
MALTVGADGDVVATTDAPVANDNAVAPDRAGLGNILPAMQVVTTEYEQAIASLESILQQGRNRLDPQTIAIIEASLGMIDRAIAEARRALADDPNNAALNHILLKHEQSKLRVLRQASAAVQI